MSKVSDRFALSILAFLLVFAICQLGFNALTLDTWMDEGKYLMKGYWYVTGKIPPYSEIDPTYYMPFAFYADGLVQWLFGIGYLPGRILMILFSVACLVLVYLVGQNLGRSRLAGVGAAALVVGHPVALIYFATATPYAAQAVDEEGWRIIALTRLGAPVPSALQNYLFGLTNVNIATYSIATFVFSAPQVFLFSFLGATGRASLLHDGSSGVPLVFSLVAILLTATIIALISWRVRMLLLRFKY